ncbi:MAG: hypothetical protein M1834_007983 [Cirrosporium novae-zelandiae]|nr:MAG: hypothetical protein M1834_007983 [Cirrosporium novae-zelandiae]
MVLSNEQPEILETTRLRVTIIGCGTLGQGILAGLLEKRPSQLQFKDIVVTARRQEHAQRLKASFHNVAVTTNNTDPRIWSAATDIDDDLHVVMISTKPADIPSVCAEIYNVIAERPTRPVILTLCPGITVNQMKAWLPSNVPIVRSMPNTPVMVRQGATGLYPCNLVRRFQLKSVMEIFKSISPSVVILSQESLLDVVASVSGSGPAYFYHLMDTMINSATELGLPEELARDLVIQSCIGSGVLAQETMDKSLLELKNDVCVPGGSTRRAMDHLDRNGWDLQVTGAIKESLLANRAMGSTSKMSKA